MYIIHFYIIIILFKEYNLFKKLKTTNDILNVDIITF